MSLKEGKLCALCQKYGKPPAQARGAWVTYHISNWSKAVELLNKHEKSEWHLAPAEAQAVAESARMQGWGVDTTTFESLIALQIDNGNYWLESHLNLCPANAIYMSKITVAELLNHFIK